MLFFQNCIAFISLCGPYNFYFNQMFEFNKGRTKLAEIDRFRYFDQALGFYDKLVFETE